VRSARHSALLRGERLPGSVALVGVEDGAFVIDAVPVRAAGSATCPATSGAC